jgi:hypothetical protein
MNAFRKGKVPCAISLTGPMSEDKVNIAANKLYGVQKAR